jgi:hypothetical protein
MAGPEKSMQKLLALFPCVAFAGLHACCIGLPSCAWALIPRPKRSSKA